MIAIMKLKGLDAEAISKALLEQLRRLKIDIKESLFAFGSDGASVMRGENGVGRMVETEVQHDLIVLHCMCHVQALSAKEGVKSSILAQTVEDLMRTIASDFSKSPKKCCRFEDIQEEWKQKILKMLKKHEVRWLSREALAKRIVVRLPALFQFYLEQQRDENSSRYKAIASYSKLKFLHILIDILGPVMHMNRAAQKTHIAMDELFDTIDSSLEVLKKLKTQRGTFEEKFDNQIEKRQMKNANDEVYDTEY